MAMLNSNTHLRVPRGFGAILEGLTREILRDQPKDIPKYAAEYFEALLKNREETGTDPSEWAAKLEDRYYNPHSFKTSDHASRTTVSNINSQISVAEDYSGQSEEDASTTTMKTNHFTKSEEEESSPTLTQAESAKGPLVASADPIASTKSDGLSNEINNSRASNNPESESHKVQLLSETVNIDAQESEGGSEENQEHTDQEDKLGNVNICAKDLVETTDAASVMEEDAEQKVAFESNEIMLQSSGSQLEITKQNQEQTNNDAIGTTSDDVEEISNNKSLVEISFDNVPDNQQSMNNELRINVEIMEKTQTLKNEQKGQLEEETQNDYNEENTSNHDNSMEESIDIDIVHQPTTKADHLVDEDTNNINNDENSSLKDNFEKFETTTRVEETNEGETDYQETKHRKLVDQDAASDSTQLTDSNVKILEQQAEILQKDDLLEDNEEEQHQEASFEKYFTVSQDQQSEEEEKEEKEEEGKEEKEEEEAEKKEEEEKEPIEEDLSDSEVKEGHPSGDQDNVNQDLKQWTDKEDTGLQEEQSDTPDPEGQINEKQEECSRPQEEEDIMDIPLDDPEANRAAAKIQAGFRGHMTRKKMKPEDKTEGEERQEDRGQ